MWDLKRKANLSDLSGWLRSPEGADPDSMEPEGGCQLCRGGWLSFDHDSEDKIVVWEPAGFNNAVCPCTCTAGEEHLYRLENIERMKELQEQVVEAMKDPQPFPVPDGPERKRGNLSVPAQVAGPKVESKNVPF